MNENEAIIRDFIASWSLLDAEKLAAYFCEDAVYHNMPAGPVKGKDQIRSFIKGFIADWTSTEWQIISLVSSADLVIVERLDCTRLGTQKVDLPCCGVFEMRNNKIQIWRDYFDMNTYVSAVSG